MDTLSRKLFKSRDARTKLRGMGGILASSPELSQTVQKYQDGGDVQLKRGGYPDDLSRTVGQAIRYNRSNEQGTGTNLTGNVIDAYLRGELDPSSKAYRDMVRFEQANGRDMLREIASQIADPYGQSPYYSSRDEITPRMSQEDAMATRRRLAGDAGIGSVSADVEDFAATPTFGTNVEYTYSTYLAENNLNDTPEARVMFARYKSLMDTREAPSSPKLFSPSGFDRAPAALGDAPMTSAVEFDPTRQYTSPDMPSAPAELSEIGTEIPYVSQTSPAAPPAAPLSTLDQLRGSVYSNNPLEDALAGTSLDSNFIGTSIIDPITGRIKEIFAEDAARNQGYKDSAAEARRQADFSAVGQSLDNDALLSSGAPVTDPLARRTNVDIAYGGSGDLYQKGIAGQMSAVRSLGDGELISIVGDPSNSLYGAAVEEMARRGMDFGEKPVIAAQKITRDAESRLFAAQEQLRAATTPAETIAAEAAIRDAEAGLQEAELNRENTPRSVLEAPAVDPTPPELLAQELGMDYVPEGETPVVEAPASGTETGTGTPVVEAPAPATPPELLDQELGMDYVPADVARRVADPEVQDKATNLAPAPDDTEDDIRTKYEARAKLFREILGEDEAGARNKGMDLAMIGLAIMSGQSPNALTNIGQGTLSGLQAMSAQNEAARERQRLVRTTALESVLAEDAATKVAEATAADKEAGRLNQLAIARINNAGKTSTQAAARNLANIGNDASVAAAEIYNDPVKRAVSDVRMDKDGNPLETEREYVARKALERQTLAHVLNPEVYGTSPAIQGTVDKLLKENDKSLVKSELLRKYPGINPADYGL